MSIRVAIAGVGNCASSLVQGVEYYKDTKDEDKIPGLMHNNFGGYRVRDIEFVTAFDVDALKVGKDLSDRSLPEQHHQVRGRAESGRGGAARPDQRRFGRVLPSDDYGVGRRAGGRGPGAA